MDALKLDGNAIAGPQEADMDALKLDGNAIAGPQEADMDALKLDGNAIAGLLQEMFGAEMTTATGTCGACGMTGPVGAAHVFRGAGIVVRCPRCGNTLVKIAVAGDRRWVSFPGLRALEMTVG